MGKRRSESTIKIKVGRENDEARLLGNTTEKNIEEIFRAVFWVVLPCKHGSTTQKTALNIILAAVRT
jgi:hypothetical protein